MESLFELVDSPEHIVKIQNDIEQTESVALDIETTGLDFKDDDILLVQIRINGNTYLIDVRTLGDRITKYILELIYVSEKPIVAHNAKFDIKFIYEKYGFLFKNIHCTMISQYLITEAKEKFYSLQELVYDYMGIMLDKSTVKDFIGATELTQEMLIYGAKDVEYLNKIRTLQLGTVESKNLEKVYDLEMKLLPVVTKMECNGVQIDSTRWLNLYEEAERTAQSKRMEVTQQIWDYCLDEVIPVNSFETLKDVLDHYLITYKKTKKEAKYLNSITLDNIKMVEGEFLERFNVGSPRQLKTALQIMGAGVESTAEDVLKSIKKKFPIANTLLEFRSAYKRATTYGKDFLDYVKEDGRIYANFNQIGTATGRFSSSKPNLQNIVSGKDYRMCFIAPEGKKLITADYSQQEFRLAGELSGDPKIIEAYKKGLDMHTATASVLYHIDLEEVTKEQRANGKTVNFAVLYGSSAWGLANTMSISEEEAELLLERFKTGFPKLVAFQEMINRVVLEKGYSVTPLGRRRGFDTLQPFRRRDRQAMAEYFKKKSRIEREGFNHIIQGGSADMVKFAMLLMDSENKWGEDFKLIMTVHDEVVVEVSEDVAEEAREFVNDIMVKAGDMFMTEIPSKVDAVVANYWSK